ncbi:hypothetical protein X975_15820, partial [Stegodyphus mimosarum]
MHIILNAWNEVTSQMISNCLKKAGFPPKQISGNSQDEPEDNGDDEEMCDETFLEYLEMCENIQVCYEKSYAEIIKVIREKKEISENETESEDENPSPAPTAAEFRQALKILRTLELKSGCTESYKQCRVLKTTIVKREICNKREWIKF